MNVAGWRRSIHQSPTHPLVFLTPPPPPPLVFFSLDVVFCFSFPTRKQGRHSLSSRPLGSQRITRTTENQQKKCVKRAKISRFLTGGHCFFLSPRYLFEFHRRCLKKNELAGADVIGIFFFKCKENELHSRIFSLKKKIPRQNPISLSFFGSMSSKSRKNLMLFPDNFCLK